MGTVLVDDGAERVHRIAVQQDVHLDQVCRLLTAGLVVEARVPLGAALQLVEEVVDDLSQRQRVPQLDPVHREVVHPLQGPPPPLTQLHDRPDIVVGGQDRGLDHRLVHGGNLARRVLAGVGHHMLDAVVHHHPVDHVRRGGDQVEVELPLQPLPHDLQMQQPQKAAPEPEPQRHAGLRLVHQRRVIELEPVQRVPQRRIVRAVDRVEPRVDHRPRILIAAQRFGRRPRTDRDRVTDPRLADILDPGHQVADLAHAQSLGFDRLG